MLTLRRVAALGLLGVVWGASSSCSSTDPENAPAPSVSGSVFLALDSISVLPGEHRQLTAEVHDVHGNLVTGQAITWSTSNDLKAIVTLTGELIGVSEGTVFIKASALNVNADSMKVVVRPKPVTNVDLVPADSLQLEVGLSSQLQVLLRNGDGEFVAGRVFTFATEDASKVEITSSGRITAVKPGRVRVSATCEGITGYTTIVSVQPSRDWSLRSAQMTQAVQVADNSIPMIAGGNAAAVTVLVGSTAPFSNIPMDVQLRLVDATGTLLYSQTSTTAGSPGTDATFQSPSAVFLVPQPFVRSDVRWQVVRDPLGRVGDDSTQNDVFPRGGPAPIVAVNVPAVKVRFVPFVLSAHNNIAGSVTNVETYTTLARSTLPVGVLTTSVGNAIATAQAFANAPVVDGQLAFYSAVLAELDLARTVAAGDPQEYWFGVIPTPSTGIGVGALPGFGYVPASPQGTGAQTRTSVGLQSTASFVYGLALNFGRRSAPCNATVVNPDPSYPNAGGVTGTIGNDVRSWATGTTTGLTTFLPTALDILAPCTGTRWVSEYTYRGVLNARGFTSASLVDGGAAATSIRAPASPVTRTIIVRGTVIGDHEVQLSPAFALDARATAPERTGPYRLEGRDAGGRVLFARDFEPAAPDGAAEYKHFTFAIPVSASVESAVATIEVRGPAGVAQLRRTVVRAALRAPSSITTARLAGGMANVTCADPEARGILVRDANTGDLLGTAAGASMRISVAGPRQINVLCSDGVGSTQAAVTVR